MAHNIILKNATGKFNEMNVRDSYRAAIYNYENEIENENKKQQTTQRFYKDVPVNAGYFKKRFCHTFVNNPINGLCQGCKESFENGKHIYPTNPYWDYKTCTGVEPTDAYGVINFPGSSRKKACYIRVDIETDPSELVPYIYHPDGWNLKEPYLLLSVIGTTHRHVIPSRIRNAFKRGLIKVASTTGAWIITFGTNTGVIKLVSEAVIDDAKNDNLIILGIAQWGKIALRNKLKRIKRKQSTFSQSQTQTKRFYTATTKTELKTNDDLFLDSNHSHYLLFDDGSNGLLNKDNNFRLNFETELRKGLKLDDYEKQDDNFEYKIKPDKIPMVLIVVQGGLNTLKSILEALINETPVLLIADTEGCVDLILRAFASVNKEESALKELIKSSNIIDNSNDEKLNYCYDILIKILPYENSQWINIYKLDHKNESADIESTIFNAVFKTSKHDYFKNLKYAIKWNRCDIAKIYINENVDNCDDNDLKQLLELSLLLNRVDFVNFFLEQGVDFRLTARQLYMLYNYEEKGAQNDNKKPPIQRLVKKRNYTFITFKNIEKFLKEIIADDYYSEFFPNDMKRRVIKKFLLYAYKIESSSSKIIDEILNRKSDETLNSDESSDDETNEKFNDGSNIIEYPEINLFLWALLMNRIQLAKLFWKIGDNHISTAFFACIVLKALANRIPDLKQYLMKTRTDFENLAISILTNFYDHDEPHINGILLLRKAKFFNVDILHMAIEANSKDFISHRSVQLVLTEIWNGTTSTDSDIKTFIYTIFSFFSCGLLAPFLLFEKKVESNEIDKPKEELIKILIKNDMITDLLKAYLKEDILIKTSHSSSSSYRESSLDTFNSNSIGKFEIQSHKEESEDGLSKKTLKDHLKSYGKLYIEFIRAPKIHFMLDTTAYLTFLTFFSYLMLCEFSYKQTIFKIKNETFNSTDTDTSLVPVKVIKKPIWIEYLLIFWIFAYISEESRQFFSRTDTSDLKNKFYNYFSDVWNFLDAFGCFFFILGILLRFIALGTNETVFSAARILLCADLFIWYMRLLHFSLLYQYLGPKLFMIQLMIRDVLFFMCIMGIFVIAFGVVVHSSLYPGYEFTFELLRNIINKGYWSIYGDLRILNELYYDPNCVGKPECPEYSGQIFTFFALMGYVVIANVLLINLLIAMFSYTFLSIQGNTDKIWKFQRYLLVLEHFDAPVIPPPLNVFGYIIEFISKKCKKCVKTINKKSKKTYEIKSNDDDNDIINEKERKYSEQQYNNLESQKKDTLELQITTFGDKINLLEQKLSQFMILFQKDNQNDTSTHLNNENN